MNAVALGTVIGIGFILQCSGFAQVSSGPPRDFENVTSLDLGSFVPRLELPQNNPETIRKELLNTNTVRLIGKASGISNEELATVQVAQEPKSSRIMIYQIGKSDRAFNLLREQLNNYIRAREDAHTRAFCLAAMTNRVQPSTITDPALRAIATDRPLLPVSWLKKEESYGSTNVVAYSLVDGEIAWRYAVLFKADGSMLDYVFDSKHDAKEYDPKYQTVIKEVAAEVHQEMERDGISRFAIYTFWQLMKKRLEAKEIEWRSPHELNPQIHYN